MTADMKHKRQVAVLKVTEQLIGMLTNNIIEDCGTESFEGWCEDGAVFADAPLYEEECIALMKEVAPIIDGLTYGHLNFGY